jgi:hypothetical protein
MTELPVCSSRASDQPAAAALPTSVCFLEVLAARLDGDPSHERRQVQASLLECMKRVLNILQDSRSLSLMPSINWHCFFHDNIALFLS